MIALPDDAAVRLHSRDGACLVIIAPPDEPSDPAALMSRTGCVSASISHDAGVAWPDKCGESLASAVLARPGGAAILVFEQMVDAVSCHRRLVREAGR